MRQLNLGVLLFFLHLLQRKNSTFLLLSGRRLSPESCLAICRIQGLVAYKLDQDAYKKSVPLLRILCLSDFLQNKCKQRKDSV